MISYCTLRKAVSYFAVVFTSMLGATFFGVSLNKIALLPIMMLLFVELLSQKKHPIKMTSFKLCFLVFCITAALSSFVGLLDFKKATRYDLYKEILINNGVQMFIIYVPLALLYWGSSHKKEYEHYFQRALLITCRLQCFWGILQFVCWSLWRLDINSVLFNDVFNGIFGTDWTVFTYENQTLSIRLSGLTCDGAYLNVFLIIGFLIERSKLMKGWMALVVLLSMSRTGMVVLFLMMILDVVLRHKRITMKEIGRIFICIVVTGFLFIWLYNNVDSIHYQINYALDRFKNIFSSNSYESTSVHKNYLLFLLPMFFTMLNPVQYLIGAGPRTAVTTYIEFAKSHNLVYVRNYAHSLAIECDVADLLVGNGLIGFSCYYVILMAIFVKSGKILYKEIAAMFLLMGIMYQFNAMTFLMLFMVIALGDIEKMKKGMKLIEKGSNVSAPVFYNCSSI